MVFAFQSKTKLIYVVVDGVVVLTYLPSEYVSPFLTAQKAGVGGGGGWR